MKLDRKGRPVSVLDAEERKALLEQLLGVWHDNPRWCLGQLVSKAATISAGARVTALDRTPDVDIINGLTALSPMNWEIEDLGAAPVAPMEILDSRSLPDQTPPV